MSDFPFSPPPPPRFRVSRQHWPIVAVVVAVIIALAAFLVNAD